MIFHRLEFLGTTGLSVLPPLRPAGQPAPAPLPGLAYPQPGPVMAPPPVLPMPPVQRVAPQPQPPMGGDRLVRIPPPANQPPPMANPYGVAAVAMPQPVAPVTAASIDSMAMALDSLARTFDGYRQHAAASLDTTFQLAIAALRVQQRRLQQRRGMGTPNGANRVVAMPSLTGLSTRTPASQVAALQTFSKAVRQVGVQIPFTDVSSRLQGLALMLNNQATRLLWQEPADNAYIGR